MIFNNYKIMSDYLTPLPYLRSSLFNYFDKSPTYILYSLNMKYISKINFINCN